MADRNALLIYVTPALAITLSVALGIVAEKVLLPRLADLARRTRWAGGDLILAPLKGNLFLWFLALGIYLTVLVLPLGPTVLDLIKKLLFVIVALSVTIVVGRLAERSVRAYGSRRGLPVISLFTNLTRLIVFLLGTLVILQALGVAITPMLTALGVGGLAVALALQDTLANLFAGLHLLASRHIRAGDYIRLESGQEGYVTDITWRSTTIRERPHNLIIVPNAKLAATIITNFDRPDREVLVPVDVGVSYDSHLDEVERVTLEVAREVMRQSPAAGVTAFEPFLRFKTLGDFSIGFTVTLRARELADRERIRHEFIKRLIERYRREEIEIPFPVQVELVKDARDGRRA